MGMEGGGKEEGGKPNAHCVLSSAPHYLHLNSQPRACRHVEQRVEAELADPATDEIIHSRLCQTEALGSRHLCHSPGFDNAADRSH